MTYATRADLGLTQYRIEMACIESFTHKTPLSRLLFSRPLFLKPQITKDELIRY